MRTHARVGIFVLGLAASVTACAATEPTSNEAIGASEQASTCSTSDLGAGTAAGVCAGPWRFRRYVAPCYAYGDWSPVCGTHVEKFTRNASCNHQTGTRTDVFDVAVNGVAVSQRVCELRDNGKPTCHNETTYDVPAGCGNRAQSELSARHGWNANGVVLNQNDRSGTCRVTVNGVPVVTYSQDPVCGTEQYPVNVPNGCRNPVYGLDSDTRACGPADADVLSPLGLTLADLSQREGSALVLGQGALDPTCTTEDTLPVEGRASARFEALWKVYSDALLRTDADAAPTVTVAAREMKLITELYGTQLTDVQRDRVMEVAGRTVVAQNACGTTSTSPARTSACAATDSDDGKLLFCQRLLEPHAPASSAAAFMGRCVGEGASLLQALQGSIAALPAGTAAPACVDPYKAVERGMTTSVLAKGLTSTDDFATASRPAAIQQRLALMNQWFEAHRPAPSALATSDQLADLAKVERAFWQGINAVAFRDVDTEGKKPETERDDTKLKAAADALQATNFQAERDVLRAAYSARPAGGATVDTEVLLYVTADALRPVVERARALAKLHDLGCAVVPCAPALAEPHESDQFWRALASLPDAGTLTKVAPSMTASPEWKAVFQSIAARHGDLEAAVARAAGHAFAADDLVQGASPALAPLAELVGDAQTRIRRFDATGLLEVGNSNVLQTGLQEEKRTEARQLVGGANEQLGKAVGDFRANRSKAIGDLVARVQTDGAVASLATKVQAKVDEIKSTADDIAGLRAAYAREELLFGKFGASYRDLAASGNFNPGFGVTVNSWPVTAPASASGRTHWGFYKDVALPKDGAPFKVPNAARGDVVAFTVRGQWSPTCALRGQNSPDGASYNPIGALTGPEGFMLTKSAAGYNATSSSVSYSDTSYHTTITNQESECNGSSSRGGLGWSYIADIGQTWSHNTEDCTRDETGETKSSTTSTSGGTGTDNRTTASFALGVRSAKAVYPKFPAGALLAVIVPPNATERGTEIDVRVLQAQSTFLLEKNADVYLVVNDVEGCSDVSGSLDVQVTLAKPTGAIIAAAQGAMADALVTVRAKQAEVLGEGGMSPEETNALRESALAAVQAQIPGGDLATVPPSLRSLFTSTLDHALAQLRRAVQIQTLERQRTLQLLELEEYASDLAHDQSSSRLLDQSVRWSLETLDSSDGQLVGSVKRAVELADTMLAPMARIRYPKAKAMLAADTTASLAAGKLIAAGPSTPFVEMASSVSDVLTGMINAIDAAKGASTTGSSNTKIVAITFPNPDPSATRSTVSQLRAADPATSKAFWDGVTTTGRAQVTITPEMLYDPALASQSVLVCTAAAPIINSMAIVVAAGAGADEIDGLNTGWAAPLAIGRDMMFPTGAGALTYDFGNPSWLTVDGLRVLFGPADKAGTVFTKYLSSAQAQAGLSPFMHLDMNLANVIAANGDLMTKAQEIILMFQVTSQSIDPPGVGDVATCRR